MENIAERMKQKRFCENTGKVLRAINVLRTRFVDLEELQYALEPNMTSAEYVDCVNYLESAEYIEIRSQKTKQTTSLADTPLNELEGKLSADGIRLLNGKLSDPCIEI